MQYGHTVGGPATVAVVGLGKIGLPLAVQYALHGYRVIGCDINPAVVAAVNAGKAPPDAPLGQQWREEPGLVDHLAGVVACGLLSATCDTAAAACQAEVIVVIVPVAIDSSHQANFQNIDAATSAIGAGLRPGTLVIYETTLPVGTTTRRLAPLLEHTAGLQAGRDFLLAFSPERVSSGHVFRDLHVYPKVVGGIDESSTVAAAAFYMAALDAAVISMASCEEAEFVKLIETTYRDVNIALANEFACYADAHGLNVTTAIAAANSQPYSHIHAPGVGVGGHCIPVYPYFLFNGDFEPLLTLPRRARHINDAMAEYAVQRVEAVTGSLLERPVLILGVSYRGNVRETASSSAQLLAEALVRRGARVLVDDPLFSPAELRAAGYTPFKSEQAGEVVAVILQAAHRAYQSLDFCQFGRCQVVLDGRMALEREKIEAQGIHYMTIGDGNGWHRERPCAEMVARGDESAPDEDERETVNGRPYQRWAGGG